MSIIVTHIVSTHKIEANRWVERLQLLTVGTDLNPEIIHKIDRISSKR